jgi:hypothetical protein
MKGDDEHRPNNREKKIEGRTKRRVYKQGTRSYLHAMLNSVSKRVAKKGRPKA